MKMNDFISRFSFHTTPFTCEIGVNEHFTNDIYQGSIDQLPGVIDKRMSAALIAPAGTGKTAILRSMPIRLAQVQVHVPKSTAGSGRW